MASEELPLEDPDKDLGFGSRVVRKFSPLALERPKVVFMPLHWVIVHAITESSPLYGVTKKEFESRMRRFLSS